MANQKKRSKSAQQLVDLIKNDGRYTLYECSEHSVFAQRNDVKTGVCERCNKTCPELKDED